MPGTSKSAFNHGQPTRAGQRQEIQIDVQATAQLVARGEMELPEDLPEDIKQQLIDRVRELRRDELLALIAEQIAFQLWHDADERRPGR